MKRIFIIILSTLLITSCASTSSSLESSSKESSSPTSSSSSDFLLNLPPAQIKDVYNDHEFSLEEFTGVTFRVGPKVLNEEGNLYVHPLYVNNVRVTENSIDRLLFAYDINKDGYRDLVFNETINTQTKRSMINGFDVHNMKKMENKLGLGQYYPLDLEITEGRVKVRSYMASANGGSTFDYGEIAYSEEKGLYFIWDNMYQFKDFKLNKITLDDESKTLVEPVINESGVNYTLKANTDYIFEIAAPREENPTIQDFDFYRQSGFDVKVGDEVLGVNRFEYVSSENDVHKFRVNFMDRVKEFVYTFKIPCMSFSINISLVD